MSTAEEEGSPYIHVRFTDNTELGFTLSFQIGIDEADLQDWKAGDSVKKRTYIQSPEFATIAAKEPEFRRICRTLNKEAKRKTRGKR